MGETQGALARARLESLLRPRHKKRAEAQKRSESVLLSGLGKRRRRPPAPPGATATRAARSGAAGCDRARGRRWAPGRRAPRRPRASGPGRAARAGGEVAPGRGSERARGHRGASPRPERASAPPPRALCAAQGKREKWKITRGRLSRPAAFASAFPLRPGARARPATAPPPAPQPGEPRAAQHPPQRRRLSARPRGASGGPAPLPGPARPRPETPLTRPRGGARLIKLSAARLPRSVG